MGCRWGVRALTCAVSCTLAWSCRAPTEITVDLSTDFTCADLRGTALVVGQLGAIETKSPILETTTCTDVPGGANVGSIVLVPSGAENAQVAFKVVAGFGKPADDCLSSFGPGCIVARRALRYLPHTPLVVPVLLSSDCSGVLCGETETCETGGCVPATIADPSTCAQPGGCPEVSDGGSQDATLDAAGDGGTVFHDVTDPSNWTAFDTTTLSAGAEGFRGAAFDGRYVYLVPYSNDGGIDGIVTRYDTQAVFTAGASWATFDTSTLGATDVGFSGAAFDGRYVYLVPARNTVVARYDTQAAFSTGGAWSTFDVSTVNGADGFYGAAFDGRYIYFAPSSGVVTRYDTQGAFTASASWATFDTSTVNVDASGYVGAAYDGRYVYFVPRANSLGFDGTVARYDTQSSGGAGFSASASWLTFDTATLNASAKGFSGAAFDGRYVYFVPEQGSVLPRYDTQYSGDAGFSASSAWSTFDTSTVNTGASDFYGAAFDGRYVYLVPEQPFRGGAIAAIVARYDTQAAFSASASWATFDTGAVGAGNYNGNFAGAAFDGRYMYFVPEFGGVVARYDAKVPPSMPPGYSGSFY